MKFDFGGVPQIAPAPPPKKEKNPWDDEEEEQERKRLLPHAAVTVCKGRLFVASHIEFLLKVIAPKEQPKLLRDDPEYKLVTAEIDKFEPKEKCFRFFSRTDEEYRTTYELIRQNKMPESETMLARMLNVLFGEGKKGAPGAEDRRQPIARVQVRPPLSRPGRHADHQRERRLVLQGFHLEQGAGIDGHYF